MKVCSKCKLNKEITEFGLKNRKGKRSSVCKDCKKEYYRQYSHNYYYDLTKRTKVRARSIVQNAVRNRTLVKPKLCEDCQQEKRLHAHHEDHTKPLEVKWLCSKCHYVADNGLPIPQARTPYIAEPKLSVAERFVIRLLWSAENQYRRKVPFSRRMALIFDVSHITVFKELNEIG